MHEQKHAENNVPRPQSSRRDPVEVNASEMRKFALENPCYTTEEHQEALAGDKFSKSFTHGKTAFVQVVLTVSPFDEKEEFLVWHCSMSIRSNSTGRAKSYGLWTKNERVGVRRLIGKFLEGAGNPKSQRIIQTATALHCCRSLRLDEENLEVNQKTEQETI